MSIFQQPSRQDSTSRQADLRAQPAETDQTSFEGDVLPQVTENLEQLLEEYKNELQEKEDGKPELKDFEPHITPPEQKGFKHYFKRVATVALIVIGAMWAWDKIKPAKFDKRAAAERMEPEEAASPTVGLSNVLTTVQEALELAKKGALDQFVKEYRSPSGDSYTYEFVVTHQETGWGGKTVYLRGVNHEERARLLKGLRETNHIIEGEEGYPLMKPQEPDNTGVWLNLAFWGVLIGFSVWMVRRVSSSMKGGGGMLGQMNEFSEHQGQKYKGRPNERFTDIGGADHVVEELKEFRDDIQKVMRGDTSVTLPRGVLMTGPPGVGKTMFARALAGEAGVPFLFFDSSRFVEMFVGVGAKRVDSAFKNARLIRDKRTELYQKLNAMRLLKSKDPEAIKDKPQQGVVLMFFDEFESLGGKREAMSNLGGGSNEHKAAVNALLQQMDGVAKELNVRIVVIAATNFKDDIDPALLRPGRFTKQFEISLPESTEDRLDILQKLSKHILDGEDYVLEDPRGLEYIAKITPGFSGDQLRAILTEAASIARHDGGRKGVRHADLFEAWQRAVAGGRIQKNTLPRERLELVAHHEHGHGIGAFAGFEGLEEPVFLVSMKKRGGSYGRVMANPIGLGEGLSTYQEMLARLLISAGGRAAELEQFGTLGKTAGASADLEGMRHQIRRMISAGMFDDYLALNITQVPPHQLPPEHIELINKVETQAVRMARRVIRAVGPDVMQALVEESLDLDQELAGPEASEFYKKRLGADKIRELNMIALEFFEDPTGDKASGTDVGQNKKAA